MFAGRTDKVALLSLKEHEMNDKADNITTPVLDLKNGQL
jgi:hypothetical protein